MTSRGTLESNFGDILQLDPGYLPGIAYHGRRVMSIGPSYPQLVVVLCRDPQEVGDYNGVVGRISSVNPHLWVKER